MPVETFNISFESTQHKQQYGSKITCTERDENKGYGFEKIVTTFSGSDLDSPLMKLSPCRP